jgi:hypothetical protein
MLKDSAYIEEHEVHYEYGKKSDPSSMGKVSGRLYVQTIDKGLYYKIISEIFCSYEKRLYFCS